MIATVHLAFLGLLLNIAKAEQSVLGVTPHEEQEILAHGAPILGLSPSNQNHTL
jgi:hypothetical protein